MKHLEEGAFNKVWQWQRFKANPGVYWTKNWNDYIVMGTKCEQNSKSKRKTTYNLPNDQFERQERSKILYFDSHYNDETSCLIWLLLWLTFNYIPLSLFIILEIEQIFANEAMLVQFGTVVEHSEATFALVGFYGFPNFRRIQQTSMHRKSQHSTDDCRVPADFWTSHHWHNGHTWMLPDGCNHCTEKLSLRIRIESEREPLRFSVDFRLF